MSVVYGRFVGDIYIGNGSINLNQWLLEQGWVFPAYYKSLTDEEIAAYEGCYQKGLQQKERTLQYFSSQLKSLNESIQFRDSKKELGPPLSDIGEVILPKFFRRLVVYTIYQKAGIKVGTLKEYLQSKDQNDQIVLKKHWLEYRQTQDFLQPLSSIVDDSNGNKVTESPNNILYIEKPSTLIDQNGDQITTF